MQTWEKIMDALRSDPGQSAALVARAMGLNESTVSYHLRRMEGEGKVSRVLVGREFVWFAAGCGLCPLLKRAVPAMRRAGVAPVALALVDSPPTLREVAFDAGVTVGEARWALDVLQDVGIATTTARGRPELVEGAEECVARALAQESCPLWGTCAPSRLATDPRRTSSRP